MEVTQTTSGTQHSVIIFPSQSISLLVAPSNSGKSTFLKNVLEHSHLFFSQQPSRVVVINTNRHCEFYSLEEKTHGVWPLPSVEQYMVGEFDVDDLNKGDIVIFEDISEVTHELKQVINVISHHVGLTHTFLISHACLGTKKFELLNYIHRVVLFCQSSSVCRLANFIQQTFFYDVETRDYLKKIISFAQTKGQILHIELNVMSGQHQSKHLALTHADKFITQGFLIIFPFLSSLSIFQTISNSLYSIKVKEKAMLPDAEDIPKNAFVLLNHIQLEQVKSMGDHDDNTNEPEKSILETAQGDDCTDKNSQQWQTIVQQMMKDVEAFVQAKRVNDAKNLLKEIIANKELCISSDGRRIRVKTDGNDKSAVVVDFIRCAIRPASPNETVLPDYHIYKSIVDTLILHNTPVSLFRNKLLLEKQFSARRRSNATHPRRDQPWSRKKHRHRPFFRNTNYMPFAPGAVPAPFMYPSNFWPR